jgi:hypothetical protein
LRNTARQKHLRKKYHTRTHTHTKSHISQHITSYCNVSLEATDTIPRDQPYLLTILEENVATCLSGVYAGTVLGGRRHGIHAGDTKLLSGEPKHSSEWRLLGDTDNTERLRAL